MCILYLTSEVQVNQICNALLLLFFVVVGFPRIGSERLVQVVILRNDNASGIVRLSSSAVVITEDIKGAFLNVVRSEGAFGQVLLYCVTGGGNLD